MEFCKAIMFLKVCCSLIHLFVQQTWLIYPLSPLLIRHSLFDRWITALKNPQRFLSHCPSREGGLCTPISHRCFLIQKEGGGLLQTSNSVISRNSIFRATLFTCCPFLLAFKTDSVGLELNWKNILNSTNRWPFTDSWKRKILCFGLRQLQGNVQHPASCSRVVKQLWVITELENIRYLK